MERGVFYEVSHAIAFAQMRRVVCQQQLNSLYPAYWSLALIPITTNACFWATLG